MPFSPFNNEHGKEYWTPGHQKPSMNFERGGRSKKVEKRIHSEASVLSTQYESTDPRSDLSAVISDIRHRASAQEIDPFEIINFMKVNDDLKSALVAGVQAQIDADNEFNEE